MTHFTMIAITDQPGEEAIGKVLAPYDENADVEPYQDTDYDWQEELTAARRYAASQGKPTDRLDEQMLRWWHGDDADLRRTEDGGWERWTTYNPKSKWDWWRIGGRWSGGLTTVRGDQTDFCQLGYLDFAKTEPTYGIVTSDSWYARGELWWWGITTKENVPEDKWAEEWKRILLRHTSDLTITLCDLHI